MAAWEILSLQRQQQIALLYLKVPQISQINQWYRKKSVYMKILTTKSSNCSWSSETSLDWSWKMTINWTRCRRYMWLKRSYKSHLNLLLSIKWSLLSSWGASSICLEPSNQREQIRRKTKSNWRWKDKWIRRASFKTLITSLCPPFRS